MDAARSVTAGAIDGGEKPAVPSAMLKYHVTEHRPQVANDAMDVHGGKGICIGPRNYLARAYQVVPVAITVEGANILTRNLIIFGQGAVRCHPFVLKEMNAAREPDRGRGVEVRPGPVRPIGFTLSNAVRSLVLALTTRASRGCRCRARSAATTSRSRASARPSRSRWTWRCWPWAATSKRRKTSRRASATCSPACISPRWC